MLKKRRKRKSSLEKAQSELKHDRNAVFNYMFDAEKDLQKAVSQAREMQKVLALICTLKSTEDIDPVPIVKRPEKRRS